MDNTINSLVSKAVGVTDDQIKSFLASNPSDAQIVSAMQTYGVSPTQLATVTGSTPGDVIARVAATIPYGQSAMLGDVVVQPLRDTQGSGENLQVGPITGINVTKSTGNVNEKAPVGSQYQTYNPDGTLQGTGTVQKYDDKFSLGGVLKDIVSNPGFKIAALATGANALGGALGGTSLGSLGSLAADADIAGGLIPEFGTNAAYNSFMSSAMTPAALASLASTVAANPEVIGSGSLLTDAAAGIPPVTTPPVVTPPVTPVVPPVVPPGGGSLLSTLGPLAGSTIGSLVGGTLGAVGAVTAADKQAEAAKYAADLQKQMFNTINSQNAPYRAGGYNALNQIQGLLPGQYTKYDANGNPIGTATGTDYLTHQFNASDFANGMDPGYAFRLQQGQMANQRMANKAGGLLGANAQQGMQDYTQGLASQEYQNAFNRYSGNQTNIYNRLASLAGIGQASQAQTNQAGQNAATNQGNLAVGSAGAQAAGLTGAANAIGNSLSAFGNNYTLAQLLNQNQSIPP
jgi:hypothetical protein